MQQHVGHFDILMLYISCATLLQNLPPDATPNVNFPEHANLHCHYYAADWGLVFALVYLVHNHSGAI